MHMRHPFGPPMAIMFCMPSSSCAPSANVTDMEAKVGSTGLEVMTAVASPARASASYLRSARVIRTAGMSAAVACSPAVSP